MALIVLAIFGLSLGAVFASYAPLVRAGPPGRSVGLVVALALFAVCAAAAIAAYMACVVVAPGYVPSGWHPFETDEVRKGLESEKVEGVFCAPTLCLHPPLPPSPHTPQQQADTELQHLLTAPPPPPPPAPWAPPRAHAGAKSVAPGSPTARTTTRWRGGVC